jgi:UDP-2,4-diacetamido-2,4,6-trideoxy-beta-L-altropyranose hydrolase
MKISILTEGSRDIGFGHLTRCTAISQGFHEKGVYPKLIVHGDDAASRFLNENEHKILNWIQENDALAKEISDSDVVIVDSYLADLNTYHRISSLAKITLAIDDNFRIKYPCEFVVNGTFGIEEKKDIEKSTNAVYFLGSQYIALRKPFWEAPEKVINEEIQTLMMTFGGDDVRNLTPKILTNLVHNHPKLRFKVVVGAGFKNREQLESLGYENVDLIHSPGAEEMKKCMLESDIAVSASGQTIYELARLGVPTLCVKVADNQNNNIQGATQIGWIDYVGEWNDEHLCATLSNGVKQLQPKLEREKRSRLAKKTVDGKGAKRIVSIAIDAVLMQTLTVRPAIQSDILSIFHLSSQDDVRANSFHSEVIKLEAHKEWFLRKLHDEKIFYFVSELDKSFSGQIRFETNGEEATVGISIDEKFRRLGLGRVMMSKALTNLHEKSPSIRKILAYIKTENIPSIKYFESCGYYFVKNVVINSCNAVLYEYKFSI